MRSSILESLYEELWECHWSVILCVFTVLSAPFSYTRHRLSPVRWGCLSSPPAPHPNNSPPAHLVQSRPASTSHGFLETDYRRNQKSTSWCIYLGMRACNVCPILHECVCGSRQDLCAGIVERIVLILKTNTQRMNRATKTHTCTTVLSYSNVTIPIGSQSNDHPTPSS